MPHVEIPHYREPSAVHRARLARELDESRRSMGMTYRELSRRTGCARSTLNDALTGRRVPRLETVLAIVRACDRDTASWRRRWVAACCGAPAGQSAADLRELLGLLGIPEDQIVRAVARWRSLTQPDGAETVPTTSR